MSQPPLHRLGANSSASGYANHPASSEAQPFVEGVRLREVLTILRRRAWIILLVTAAVSVTAAFWLSRQQPVYRATALVLMADARRTLIGGIDGETPDRPVGRFTDPLLSQISILQGRTVLGQVVDRLGLRLVSSSEAVPRALLSDIQIEAEATVDSLNVQFLPEEFVVRAGVDEVRASYGIPVEIAGVLFAVRSAPAVSRATFYVIPREAAISAVGGGLSARPRERTDIIEVTYTARERQRASLLANAIAEEFQAHNAHMAQQRSRRRRIFLEQQLRNTDSALAEAQLALSTFRKQRQLFNSREQLNAQQQALMGVDIRREELEADRRMYESFLSSLQQADGTERAMAIRAVVSSPGIASNPVISQLYTQLTQYEATRDGLTTGPMASTASNPEVVRLNTLIASTEKRILDAVRSQVSSLESRIRALDGLRGRNLAELKRLPDAEVEEARLLQQVESSRRMADELRTDLQRARIAEAVEAGQAEIIHLAPEAARVPLGRATKLGFAVLLGFMLGCGGAFAAEAMNTSLRRREELDVLLQVPSLATIPRIPMPAAPRRRLRLPAIVRSAGGGAPRAAGEAEPGLLEARSHGAEAYRKLRNNLVFSQREAPCKVLVITSALPAEGKTQTAANLAIAFALDGKRVLLVDCDLHRARIHDIFRLPRQPGLSELVTGQVPFSQVAHATSVAGLSVLPAGSDPRNGTELFQRESLSELLRLLASSFDHVVIDAPPILPTADAAAVAAIADGVLFVVRVGGTERGMAEQALHELSLAGARVIGSVLNDPEEKLLDGPYSSYYSYAAGA